MQQLLPRAGRSQAIPGCIRPPEHCIAPGSNEHALGADVFSEHAGDPENFCSGGGPRGQHAYEGLLWDPTYLFLRMDEVMPGAGIQDYELLMKRLDELWPDMSVFTEHWRSDAEFVEAIQRLRAFASATGASNVAHR